MKPLPIDDRDRWLLTACLAEGKALHDAFRAWRPFANPADMRGRELRLMPLLLANLKRAGIDDPAMGWLKAQAKHIWLTGALRNRVFHRALDVLDGSGIPRVLIKGTALRARWPAAVATRPMGDFDVLLSRRHVRDAFAALHSAGWRSAAAHLITDDDLDRFHALAVYDRHGNNLDLHWRPAEMILKASHAEGVMARAIDGRLDGRAARLAGLTDHLFILLAHAFNDTVMQRHDWIAEIALLLRLGSPEEWDRRLLAELCRRHRLDAWAMRALSLVREISGTELPAGFRAAIRPRPSISWMLQDRDIALRGRLAEAPLDRLSRRLCEASRGVAPAAGRRARGLEDSFHEALRHCRFIDRLAPVGRDGFDLARQPGGASFLRGWSVPEQEGRWTDGDSVILALRLADAAAGGRVFVKLSVHPYLADAAHRLSIRLWAGGETKLWSSGDCDHRQILIEGRALRRRHRTILPLSLGFEGLQSREERLRLGRDHRALGLFLKTVSVTFAAEIPVLAAPQPIGQARKDDFIASGWGDAEPLGRWSVAREAELVVRLPRDAGSAPCALRLVVLDCFSGAAEGQTIDVAVNGRHARRHVFPSSRGVPGVLPGGTVDIPLGGCIPGDIVHLSLRIGFPASPHGLGLSGDRRELGIFLGEITPCRLPAED